MKNIFKKRIISFLLIIVLIFIPFIVKNLYFLHILIIVGIYIILALSLNLIVGYTGQLSLGHAAFYGIGAYASALLSMKLNISFIPALLIAGFLSAFIGLVIGYPVLKLRGPYFVIATLAFGEIVRHVFINWVSLTGGPMGLRGIPPPIIKIPYLFTIKILSRGSYYYLIFILVMLTIYVNFRIVNSGIGRTFIAIREDDILAKFIGINTAKYKILSFVIGVFFAGVAGSFYAHYACFLSPDSFTSAESETILVLLLVGGKGSLLGPIIGAIIFSILPEVLRTAGELRLAIYALILIFTLLFFPDGIMGIDKLFLKNESKKKGTN